MTHIKKIKIVKALKESDTQKQAQLREMKDVY